MGVQYINKYIYFKVLHFPISKPSLAHSSRHKGTPVSFSAFNLSFHRQLLPLSLSNLTAPFHESLFQGRGFSIYLHKALVLNLESAGTPSAPHPGCASQAQQGSTATFFSPSSFWVNWNQELKEEKKRKPARFSRTVCYW